jgi:hypothetical protein
MDRPVPDTLSGLLFVFLPFHENLYFFKIYFLGMCLLAAGESVRVKKGIVPQAAAQPDIFKIPARFQSIWVMTKATI